MTTYQRFEDLPVWQTAADLAIKIFDWTSHGAFRGKGDLANQLQRVALSISNNIAEGFERGTTKELLTFLYYARGSAAEVRSMLVIAPRLLDGARDLADPQPLHEQCESISRQLRGWAANLQNSDIAGQRHLNNQSRQDYAHRKTREQWQRQRREFFERQTAELRAAQEARDREE